MQNLALKRIINYFFQGLLFILPITATVFVLIKAFNYIDTIIPFDKIIPFQIPGLGLIVILISVTILGYISGKFISNPMFVLVEKGIERAPIAKIIYSSVKDLVGAFVGEKKRFNQPVLVTINNHPLVQKLGFITSQDLTEMGIDMNMVAVYLPYSYGFSGELMIVERESIKLIDANGTETMKFVISGGVTEL